MAGQTRREGGREQACLDVAHEFLFIVCQIEDCPGEVIWVISDDEEWNITCPKCGKTYKLEVQSDE